MTEGKMADMARKSRPDLVDGVVKNISKGNLLAAISENESVKTLITKRNKLIRFADKSPRAGQPLRSTSRMS